MTRFNFNIFLSCCDHNYSDTSPLHRPILVVVLGAHEPPTAVVDLPVNEVPTRTVTTASPIDDLHKTWQHMMRQRLNPVVVAHDGHPMTTTAGCRFGRSRKVAASRERDPVAAWRLDKIDKER